MVEYTKINVKLSNIQIKKLKDVVKGNTGTTLRISLKMRQKDKKQKEEMLSIIICQLI